MATQNTAQIRKLDGLYPHWEASKGSKVKDTLSFRANILVDGKLCRGRQLVPSAEGGRKRNPSRGEITRMIADAEAALARHQALNAAPSKGNVYGGTWKDAANKYLEAGAIDHLKGRAQVYNLIDKHVRRGPFADEPVASPDFPAGLAKYLRNYPHPAYKPKVFQAFDRIAKWLVDNEYHNHVMTQTKVCRVKFPNPRKTAQPEPVLTDAEANAIIQHMRPQHRDFVHFLLLSGWRPKAVRHLRKEDLQLERKTPVAFRLTKGHETTRKEVPLHPALVPMLRRLVAERPGCPWVFPNPDGSQRSDKASMMSQYIREALEAGGITPHRRIRQYSLRHSAAAKYKDAGVDMSIAVELLDHSVEMYVTKYGRTSRAAGAEALERALDYGLASTAPDSFCGETEESAETLRRTHQNHPLKGGLRACENPSESMGLASGGAACCASPV